MALPPVTQNSPNGTYTAIAECNAVGLWETGKRVHAFSLPLPAQVASLFFSPDSKTLLVGDTLGACSVFDIKTQEVKRSGGLKHLDGFCRNGKMATPLFAFSSDGTTVARGLLHLSHISVWKLAEQKSFDPLYEYGHRIKALTLSANGQKLAVLRDRGSIEVWDPATKTRVCTVYSRGDRNPFHDMQLSSDGTLLEVVSNTGTIRRNIVCCEAKIPDTRTPNSAMPPRTWSTSTSIPKAFSAASGKAAQIFHLGNPYSEAPADIAQEAYDTWYQSAVVETVHLLRRLLTEGQQIDTRAILLGIGRKRKEHAQQSLSLKQQEEEPNTFGDERLPKANNLCLITAISRDRLPYERYAKRASAFPRSERAYLLPHEGPEWAATGKWEFHRCLQIVPGTKTVVSLSEFVKQDGQCFIEHRDPCHTEETALIFSHLNALVDAFFRQDLTSMTQEALLRSLAPLHWWLSHLTFFERGSAACTEIFVQALAFAKGYSAPLRLSGLPRTPQNKEDASQMIFMDLEAIFSDLESFTALYPALIANID